MITTRTAELLRRLRHGILDQADTAMLEQIKASQLVDELRSEYRFTFQERRLRDKWELSLARFFRPELISRPTPDSLFVSFIPVPAYVNCIMLSIEGESITGISRVCRLTVRAVR